MTVRVAPETWCQECQSWFGRSHYPESSDHAVGVEYGRRGRELAILEWAEGVYAQLAQTGLRMDARAVEAGRILFGDPPAPPFEYGIRWIAGPRPGYISVWGRGALSGVQKRVKQSRTGAVEAVRRVPGGKWEPVP